MTERAMNLHFVLKNCAMRIKTAKTRAVLVIGKELDKANRLLDHGEYLRWVRDEAELSASTAHNILTAYRQVVKNPNFANLPRSALYDLSRPSTPEAARAHVAHQLLNGLTPNALEVAAIIEQAVRDEPVVGRRRSRVMQSRAADTDTADALRALDDLGSVLVSATHVATAILCEMKQSRQSHYQAGMAFVAEVQAALLSLVPDMPTDQPKPRQRPGETGNGAAHSPSHIRLKNRNRYARPR